MFFGDTENPNAIIASYIAGAYQLHFHMYTIIMLMSSRLRSFQFYYGTCIVFQPLLSHKDHILLKLPLPLILYTLHTSRRIK